VHLGLALRREVQGQHRAHREPARDDRVAALAQPVMCVLDARIPVAPAGHEQVVLVAAMAGELAAMHREALSGDALGDEFQLQRRAAEPVHQQKAGRPVAERETVVGGDHGLRLTRAKS